MEALDPFELTLKERGEMAAVEEEIKRRLVAEGIPDKAEYLGWCHQYWAVKKQVFLEWFDHDWKSPQDLSPGVIYD